MANGGVKQQVLSEQDLARINDALAQLKNADTVIDMAQRAGIDVKSFADRSKVANEQLLRIKNTFFPGR